MWNALVNIVKRCLRTVLRKPVAKRETRVQNPPEEYDEQDAALAYAHKLMTEFLDIYHQWKAGTLPPEMYRKLAKPLPRKKRQRTQARPIRVRRTPIHPPPRSHRAPLREAPPQPKYLRPLPCDSPDFFKNVPNKSPHCIPFVTKSK
jgi:hypothetical protein